MEKIGKNPHLAHVDKQYNCCVFKKTLVILCQVVVIFPLFVA